MLSPGDMEASGKVVGVCFGESDDAFPFGTRPEGGSGAIGEGRHSDEATGAMVMREQEAD